MVARYRAIGLVTHIGAAKLGFSGQYIFKMEQLGYVLSLTRTLLSLFPDVRHSVQQFTPNGDTKWVL